MATAGVSLSALLGEASPECQARFSRLEWGGLLVGLPGVGSLNRKEPPPPSFRRALGKWPKDRLVRTVMELEQEYGGSCPLSGPLKGVLYHLKQAYLRRLGLSSEDDVDLMFRSWILPHIESDRVAKALRASGAKRGLERVGFVYGGAELYRGVVVVGAGDAVRRAFRDEVERLCGGTSPCLFFDPLPLLKVVLVKEQGVAAFVPELGTLVLSEMLFLQPHTLHRFVLAHEFAHVLERAVWLTQRQDWAEAFSVFSGWEKKQGRWVLGVKELPEPRKDELTELSLHSPFGLLPDPVVFPTGGGEGFVTSRSYRETLSRNDVSEDLADHVAAFHVFPERFCWKKKNLASRKWAWLRQHFPSPRLPEDPCHLPHQRQ